MRDATGRRNGHCGASDAHLRASLRRDRNQQGTLFGIKGCTGLLWASASPIGIALARGQGIAAAQLGDSHACQPIRQDDDHAKSVVDDGKANFALQAYLCDDGKRAAS